MIICHKFRATINGFFGRGSSKLHLGLYDTIEEASAIYEHAAANKKALVAVCEYMEKAERVAHVRAACAAAVEGAKRKRAADDNEERLEF